ncbi:CsbD family protein [Paracoccus liaowanqingii]|uniref:CsbD family protein n=1 Tax=Paracoccus liaowanqingii TaxID=2560053 RepID=A0A4P7HJR3_9RHOB|nr:CsbD family protein [Paracoccus liaowanqingii]QBX34336.1 CsbD family protein [Paracoccus liaowanqingii]
MDKDRIKGKTKDLAGTAKETFGKATGDKQTERSGKADQAEGKVQEGVGNFKDAFRGDK